MTGSPAPKRSRTGPIRRKGPAAPRFRAEIEAAEAAGVKKKKMVLRLTLRDVSELKRDPSVAIEDIRYADGEMKFLGVAVAQGGVTESVLDTGEKP